jgi:pyruvate dehydrogenase E2 component (dihydrolipoamide acetyltransferase)
MATAINMPQVGQDIETARILEWFVEVGQEVSEGDILATVESDKANFEVEAFETGIVLALLFKEGDTAEVLKPIAYIGAEGEEFPVTESSLAGDTTPATSYRKAVEAPVTQATSKGKSFSSPSARRMARESDLEIGDIKGSGPGGRIVHRDVAAFLETNKDRRKMTPLARNLASDLGLPKSTLPGTGPAGKIVRNDILGLLGRPRSNPLQPDPGDRVVPFDRTRKRIAERLSFSTQTIPHYYLFKEVDMSNALVWRERINHSSASKTSVNDILVNATARALKEFPEMNAHVDEEKLLIKPRVNMGIAVSTSNGLLVPVIAGAETLNIHEISELSSKIVADARRGVISSAVPGTFTISNLGMFGIQKFLPIINPPECAILGVGSIDKKVVPEGAGYKFIDCMTLGLACDHRAVDGDRASLFLEQLRKNLEHLDLNG